MILKCQVCGKEFEAIRKSAKYCSSKCSNFIKNNKPKAKERRKKYDEEHKEKASIRVMDKYRNLTEEELKEHKKKAHEYYLRTKEKTLERNKKWKEENEEQYKNYCHKYTVKYNKTARGKIMNTNRANRRRRYAEKLDAIDYKALKVKFDKLGNKCVVCGATEKITIDHIVPLSLGGTNDIDNLQPLCQSCNSSKGTKSMNEFLKKRRNKYAN